MNDGNAGLGIAILLVGLIVGLAIYFAPTIAAVKRDHPNTSAIFALNFLLGWSVFGWVIALVWALSKPTTVIVQASPVSTLDRLATAAPVPRPSIAEEIQKLAALRDSGALTADEFDTQKRKLLA